MRQPVAVVVSVLTLFVASVVLGSQPGQPLDCEDWVFVDSGGPATIGGDSHWLPARAAVDAQGRIVSASTGLVPTPSCQPGDNGGLQLVARVGESEVLIAYLPNRCGDLPGTFDQVESDIDWTVWQWPVCPRSSTTRASCIATNIHTGEIFVSMRQRGAGYSAYPGRSNYDSIRTCRLSGFTRLFDVIESFDPALPRVSFRVPAHPEGLASADRFDTYWGEVTRPPSLAQAHPLQCAYPDHQSQVGEYLTFPDAAPMPAPGNAIYYLTSVSYQGQTRAGQQALGGALNGRDASVLPPCVVEKDDRQ